MPRHTAHNNVKITESYLTERVKLNVTLYDSAGNETARIKASYKSGFVLDCRSPQLRNRRLFPNINRLAVLCEMSRRSVETHITALEDQGLLKRISQYRDTGGKTANSYLLELTGTLENSDDAQNLRMVCEKFDGDTQNLRMNNLVKKPWKE